MPIQLSVNLNKVATVRNARGGEVPSVVRAGRVCLEAGARGLTLHPRHDQRHIRPDDVRKIADLVGAHSGSELNLEGDPRPDFLELVQEIGPDQVTLVPVRPGEITSQAGWPPDTPIDHMRRVIEDLHGRDIRVSVFIEPDERAIVWAAQLGADRVELYTEPYARAFAAAPIECERSFQTYRAAAQHAHDLGLGINAGHDLDLDNLVRFRELPHLAEVSIGHALISEAIFHGLAEIVRRYLEVLAGR